MKTIKNLKIIGTSHISKESVKEVQDIINQEADLVALELDQERFMGILKNKKSSSKGVFKRFGIIGGIISIVLQKVQTHLGTKIGSTPGDEFRAAIKASAKKKAQVLLIDQPIDITIKRLKKAIKLKYFFRAIKKSKKYGKISFDLKKVPSEEMIEDLIMKMQDIFPELYNALVHERNVIMAYKLIQIMNEFPDKNIVAIVGAGHVPGMYKIISETILYQEKNDNHLGIVAA